MEAPILLMLMIDQKTIDTIYILKILVWAFNFITNKITSGLNIIFFFDKKYDVIILSYYIFDFTC